jgi:hypothetical protein
MCKTVKLSHCLYKIDGTKTDHQGIPSQVATKLIHVKGEKDIVQTILSKQWDKSIILTVKHV